MATYALDTWILTAVVRKQEIGYLAQCAETGTKAEGATPEEALERLKEATQDYLKDHPLPQQGIIPTIQPFLTLFEVGL